MRRFPLSASLRSLASVSFVLGLAACGGHAPAKAPSSSTSLAASPQAAYDSRCMDDAPIPGLIARAFRHSGTSFVRATGGPRHRARDRFLRPDDPQIVVGKFAYGLVDKDLKDEDVDVFVRRDCSGAWEKLGTATTTREDTHHPAVDGVEDRGGQVFFTVPDSAKLGLGMHQVRFVVAGDLTQADAIVEVVSPGTPIFVSDVDGTLTSSENVEFLKVLEGKIPDTHPGAAEAFRILVAKGYRAMYLTARPELLVPRTRAFLRAHGFPAGVVHTSPATFGAGMGASAADFKKGELGALAALGLKPTFAFGNMPSDSDAYAEAGVEESHRIFYRIDGTYRGRRIDSYEELLEPFRALPPP